VTIDPSLLRAVDDYVGEHHGLDRSKVIDEALLVWYANRQADEMARQFEPEPTDADDEHRTWRRIRREAAAKRLTPRRSHA
jgi:hypothetical protein